MRLSYRGVECKLLVFVVLLGVISCDYVFHDIELKFYEGGSFQVSIPAEKSVSLLSFQGQKSSESGEDYTWDEIILEPTGGKFVFYDENANFTVGNVLVFHLQVIFMGLKVESEPQFKQVTGKRTNLSDSQLF